MIFFSVTSRLCPPGVQRQQSVANLYNSPRDFIDSLSKDTHADQTGHQREKSDEDSAPGSGPQSASAPIVRQQVKGGI
jgi:hypothetical protein